MVNYIWKQALGELWQGDKLVGKGYAGAPGFINDSSAERLPNKGPLPRGGYKISLIYQKHPKFGPLCCVLTPDKENVMFGRSAFLVHADSITRPGKASEGCIILPYSVRRVLKVGDRITVV